MFWRNPTPKPDKNEVRRQTAELIPRNYVVSRSRDDFLCARAIQNFAGDKTKTHSMTVTEKFCFGRKVFSDFIERFVAARRRHAIRLGEQCIFQITISAVPFGDFQT